MSARRFLAPAAVVLASVAVYAGSPRNAFVLDDHQVIEQNPVVTEPGRALDALSLPYQPVESSSDLLYRPVTTLTFAAQWALHGADGAWAFHLANVLLHAAASLLAWMLAGALLPGRPRAALLAGVAFAVHAIHTDAVSSVVGRGEVLAAGFAIASFLAWRAFAAGAGWGAVVLAAAAYLLGIGSKESAGPLPLFALAWTLVALRTGEARRGRAALVMAAVVAFVVPVAVYAVLRWNALGGALVSAQGRYFAAVDGLDAFLTMAGIGARYLALMVVPWPLAPDYSFESIPIARSAVEPWTAAGLVAVPAVVIAAAWAAARGRGRGQGAGLGAAWLLVFMLPAGNLVPIMVPMAERLAYAASAGACVAIGAVLDAAVDRLRTPAAALAVAWLVALAAITVHRDAVWRDDLTLWSDAVTVHPRSALAWANLGQALAAEGRAPAAVAALHRALEVAPGKWVFRVALADILHQSGLHRDEADALREGVRLAGGVPPDPKRLCAALAEVEPGVDASGCVRP